MIMHGHHSSSDLNHFQCPLDDEDDGKRSHSVADIDQGLKYTKVFQAVWLDNNVVQDIGVGRITVQLWCMQPTSSPTRDTRPSNEP